MRVGATIIGSILMGAGALFAAGGHSARVKENLSATAAAPDGRGKVNFLMKSASRAKLRVGAYRLAGGKTFDLLVGGVKVGTIATSLGGTGRVSFSAAPAGNYDLLGFDPRGEQMTVRDQDTGEDVLVGDIPSDDPTSLACCLAGSGDDHGEVECEDMSADECTAAGGTPQAVDSCLPNPCADTAPANEALVCCTNSTHDDESEAECEDVASAGECAALGGTIVQADSCDDDPCNGAAPVDRTACCVPHRDGEIHCEVLTTDACLAHGGTSLGLGTGTASASCRGNPCGGGGDGGGDDGGDGGGDDGGDGGGDDGGGGGDTGHGHGGHGEDDDAHG